ncbi:MAG: ABC transporter permease [Gemmatimonadaceae bacterium]|jgi:ABC-2 type transport system permease protein|nr:ABC transporter permease [Gemmatimonadaceae bacterium]
MDHVRAWLRVVGLLVRKEFLQVFRDKATVFQIFFIPVVQLLILSNAATFDVPRARLAVADADGTTTSAALIARLEGGGRFRLLRVQPTPAGFESALLDREVAGILHVPAGFERDLVRRGAAPVQLEFNAEEGATAGVMLAAAQGIIAEFARDRGAATPTVIRGAPLDLRTRGWFNPSRNYKHYMVPAILVSLTSIIGLLLTAQNITREKELGTLEQLNVTPLSRGQFIAGKLVPFWLLALAIFLIGLVIGRVVFGIPVRGNPALVLGSAMIYLVVALGVGLWISTVTATQQQTMFVAFFVLLLYLLMSGLFTPVDSMPTWAQWLAQLNPVKHFVVIMRTVLVRGGDFAAIWREVAILAAGGVAVMTLAVRQHRKQSA